jgi:hypothetical protein
MRRLLFPPHNTAPQRATPKPPPSYKRGGVKGGMAGARGLYGELIVCLCFSNQVPVRTHPVRPVFFF